MNTPYLPYRRILLSPQRVKELSTLRPHIPILHTIVCWSMILAAWLASARYPYWWVVGLAMLVVGNRYYALFIIGHDAFHRRVFDNSKLNDAFGLIFLHGPIAAVTRLNRQNHLSHHSQLASHNDPDRAKYACSSHYELSSLLGYLTGITTVARTLLSVYMKPVFHSNDARSKYSWHEVVVILGWQIGLGIVLTGSIGWWAYPVLWLLPVYLFTYLADGFRSFAEHSQPYQDSEADDHRLITYLAPAWERVLFAPMNMNYHAAHHLWPSIPYYNLPIADREIRVQGEACGGLEWRTSYVRYLLMFISKTPIVECRQ